MDRARLGGPDAPPAEAAVAVGEPVLAPVDPLADEIRHSALLLGGALGSMGLVALLLLVLTTRLGG